jgi:hypothetical protein
MESQCDSKTEIMLLPTAIENMSNQSKCEIGAGLGAFHKFPLCK